MSERIHHGMDLRKAKQALEELGGYVRFRRKSGESVWTHPATKKAITVNDRRKDSPRKVTSFLKRLAKSFEQKKQ